MSTKTTFKRVALVAVAALGFGLLSVVPSSATQQADTLALSAVTTANSTGTIGTAVSTTLTQSFFGDPGDTMSVMAQIVSYPSGFAVAPTLTAFNSGQGGTNLPQGTNRMELTDTITASGVVTGTTKVSFTPTGAGTYVFSFTPYRGTAALQAAGNTAVASTAAVATWTVTVAAAASAAPADSYSFAVLDAGTAVSAGSTDAVVVLPISSGSAIATIRVYPRTGDASTASTGSTTLVASIAGPGTITNQSVVTLAASGGARSVTTTSSNGTFWVYVYGDGTSGTSTVTLTMGAVVLTKTVKFYGTAASVTATLVKPVINTGSSNAGVVTAVVKDAAGNPVPGASLWLVSGTPTVFASATSAVVTSGSTGKASFSITGLTAGTSTVTLQSYAVGSAAGTTGYSSTAVSVRVGDDVTASVVMSLDKATYAQGEAAVLTVTQKDAAGNLIADGTNSPFSSAISSRVISGSLPGDSLVTTGSNLGVLTYKINVPTTSGAFTISATAGSGFTGTYSVTATVSPSAAETAAVAAAAAAAATAAAANAAAAAAATAAAANAAAAATAAAANAAAAEKAAAANAAAAAAAIAAAADIASSAADAAAEATDAANAATDAANAAAEAADAATAAAQDAADAVTALATQVADLIAGLTAQISAQKAAITALTNLVIKIQKKVKA